MSPIYMKIPFAEKEFAKALGAGWDWDAKLWFAPTPEVRAKCMRWPEVPAPAKQKPKPTVQAEVDAQEAVMNAGTQPIVGDRYFDLNCGCVPWDLCATCQRVMAVMGNAWMGGVHPAQLELSGVTQ
jgi:hypothetical protein